MQHAGHTLKPLDEVYDEKAGQIKEHVGQLRDQLTTLIHHSQDIEQNMEMLRMAKEERVREIRCCVELIITRLDSQLKAKYQTLQGFHFFDFKFFIFGLVFN